MKGSAFASITLLSFCAPLTAAADEGMWLVDKFPKELTKKYGFTPDEAWLEHVRLSSARIAGKCSASFVSPSGLVLTNHHCARSCIQELSTPERDLLKAGFYAKKPEDELKCPKMEVHQLIELSDVTGPINKAAAGVADQAFNDAQKAEMSRIEKACATGPELRCEVVSLFHGGAFHLYKYRRFQDVRLVFAPELATAHFGGDPDNFNFPRFEIDLTFLRVYQNDKPVALEHFFRFSRSGAKEGQLTFVSGNPGTTEREATVAELEYQRDAVLPWRLYRLAEYRGLLTEFQRRGAEEERISTQSLFSVENSFKALHGRHQALLDPRIWKAKQEEEARIKERLSQKSDLEARYAPAFAAIQQALIELRSMRLAYANEETMPTTSGDLLRIAWTLVRGAEELPKPNDKRFRELTDSALPGLTHTLFSTAPIYDSLETLQLGFALTKVREDLGADDPFVKKALGKESPEGLAARLVSGTQLKDVAVRKKLWEGGKKAIEASDDPLIRFARLIEPEARAIRRKYEERVESVLKKNGEAIARARVEVGVASYPDATFTLRLSYGQVKGWEEPGRTVKPFTTFAGAFERATGHPPFDLPASWLAAKSKLNLATPLDFCTTNDVIGGNSGSPVIDKDAQVVGLIFDGNIHSLGGEYLFDERTNRAVAVDSAAIIEALEKIYGASRIVLELSAAKPGSRPRPSSP